MTKLLLQILFLVHWGGCIFHFMADPMIYEGTDTWIFEFKLENQSVYEKYIHAVYFCFETITTVGYGDIHPINTGEVIFAMIFMIVSSTVFGFIVGSIVTIMNKQETLVAEIKLQRTYINQFLVQNKVPKSIKIKIKNYLDYMIDYK